MSNGANAFRYQESLVLPALAYAQLYLNSQSNPAYKNLQQAYDAFQTELSANPADPAKVRSTMKTVLSNFPFSDGLAESVAQNDVFNRPEVISSLGTLLQQPVGPYQYPVDSCLAHIKTLITHARTLDNDPIPT